MSPHQQARFQDALNALLCVTCWHPGARWVEVVREPVDGSARSWWTPVRGPLDRARVVRTVQRLDERYSPEITLSLPRRERGFGSVGRCTALWVRVEGSDQLERARRFKPLPTIVLQEGSSSRRLLIWAVSKPMPWTEAVRANKRIAYALRAPQKWSDPDLLRIPAPGSCLRVGRTRPAPVVVGRLDLDAMYRVSDVVKRLKDPPPADAWMKGKTA